MIIGVAYYPEHWPEDRWPADARMMRETGIDVVRVGEFAWSRLEPKRLTYDMDWLHRAIEALATEGLRVILCTPTAAPPSWLFGRHPSITPQDFEGRTWYMGSRRHVCLNNRPYRRYVRRIVREVARQFAETPAVMGWQIDNEIGCHGSGRCYCDDCEQAFREWLKGRYGKIERLNKMWGTVFWSQEAQDWHFVPAPRRTPAGPHPSLALDYARFISASVREFVAEQKELILEYGGSPKPITTNCLGLGTDQIDQFALAAQLDVAAYDNYPVSAENLDTVALELDLARSLKRGPFWVPEQQAGATMIRTRRTQPRPGQLRLWSYQAAARGAGLLGYFRWRTCPFGQEMHWHGLLNPDGGVTRRYEELRQTIAELKEGAAHWEGRLPEAKVAIVLDYQSHWALRADPMGGDADYMRQLQAFYGLLRRRGLAVDLLAPGQSPSGYSVLVVPMPVVAGRRSVEQWSAFVREGGVLLATAPAGYRTEYNTWVSGSPPGPLTDLLGVRVVEHDVLRGGAQNALKWDDQEYAVSALCCVLEPAGADEVAHYRREYYADSPALTHRADGEGHAYFLGAVAGEELYDRLVELVLEQGGVEPCPWSSETLEVVPLGVGPDEPALCFVLNHAEEPASVELADGAPMTDLLTGRKRSGTVRMEGFEVLLLQGEGGAD